MNLFRKMLITPSSMGMAMELIKERGLFCFVSVLMTDPSEDTATPLHMIASSRGSTTTARSTVELEATRWREGVKRWANMVKSSEKMLVRQEKASTSNITLVAMPKGSAEIVSTNSVPCNITSCKAVRTTHSASVVTRHSARFFHPQQRTVAGYLNMHGTATVAFLAMYIATGSSSTSGMSKPPGRRYAGATVMDSLTLVKYRKAVPAWTPYNTPRISKEVVETPQNIPYKSKE